MLTFLFVWILRIKYLLINARGKGKQRAANLSNKQQQQQVAAAATEQKVTAAKEQVAMAAAAE